MNIKHVTEMSNPFDIIDARLSNIESLLLDIIHKPGCPDTRPEADEDPLTVKEAAEFLKLSVPTMYTLIHENRIPHMKSAKRVYFLKEDLLAYLKKGRRKTREEILREADERISENKKRKG